MKIDNKKTVTFWLHFVFANNNCKFFSYLCLNGVLLLLAKFSQFQVGVSF